MLKFTAPKPIVTKTLSINSGVYVQIDVEVKVFSEGYETTAFCVCEKVRRPMIVAEDNHILDAEGETLPALKYFFTPKVDLTADFCGAHRTEIKRLLKILISDEYRAISETFGIEAKLLDDSYLEAHINDSDFCNNFQSKIKGLATHLVLSNIIKRNLRSKVEMFYQSLA